MRILVAEDNPVFRHLLIKNLEQWGHEVVPAGDGREAWEKFRSEPFPIVISDWIMPNEDGLDLIRRIRESKHGAYVFIILLTAKSEKTDLVEGMQAGADDFLSKPFDLNELRVRLAAGERIVQLERTLQNRNSELEAANQRMKHDLDAAARIQHSLLPQKQPKVPGLRFAWAFQPCEELAGDLLNVHELDESHISVYLLDVSGHGVPAALLSVTLSRMLTPSLDRDSLTKQRSDNGDGHQIVSPGDVLQRLSERFQFDPRVGQYFTLLYGIWNVKTNAFHYASAGHHGPLVISQTNGSKAFEATGVPIGLLENASYDEHVIELNAGDRLYLFSDGIPEAMSPERSQFEVKQLMEFLEQERSRQLDESVSGLVEKVNSWCGDPGPDDDVSCLAIEVSERAK